MMRENVANFLWTFLLVVSFISLKRLHAIGQGLSEIFIDSVGIAAVYTALTYFLRDKNSRSASDASS